MLSAAPAAAAEDLVLKAVTDELSRNMERLKMDSLDRPYFLSYYVTDSTETEFSAAFGALRDDSVNIAREAAVDLRIGNQDFDNSWYAGQDFNSYLPGTAALGEEADYDSLRFSLWSLTDDAYTRALEKYSQKKAYQQKKNIAQLYGDLSAEKKELLLEDEPVPAPLAPAVWRETVRKVSAIFRKYPKIQESQAALRRVVRTVRFANSEGTRYRYYRDGVTLEIKAEVQTAGGLRIADEKAFYWSSPPDVPPDAKLEAETEAFARDMSYVVDSSTAEAYLGPVLFEDQGAAEFLGQLFVNNISFSRNPWSDRDDMSRYYMAAGELTKKLGMRVLPGFLSVSDNPLETSWHGTPLLGAYPIDNEGVRPSGLELVRSGKLVNFYVSRAPVEKFRSSNGHARGYIREFPTARPGNVFFSAQPEKKVSRAELRKELLRLAAENGLDYAVIVRRLDPWDEKKSEDLLAGPMLAYKVSVKDGSETLINGEEWTGVTFRALRDIMLVSDDEQVYNYYQPTPFFYTRGYVPASIIAPAALLVQEMELKPTDAKPDRQPYLPHPYFEKK